MQQMYSGSTEKGNSNEAVWKSPSNHNYLSIMKLVSSVLDDFGILNIIFKQK